VWKAEKGNYLLQKSLFQKKKEMMEVVRVVFHLLLQQE
jgi:hypothetical protein